MNFTYENQGTNTYLVYTVSSEESIDSMTLGMLTNNKIPGMASTLFTQMDATKYIKYNVSAHIPASQFFAGSVNKRRLLGVFKGIVSAILSAEDYMIDESAILLDMDYIFADVTTCDTVLICLPIEHEAKCHDLGAFFKGIMFSTQFDQTENCDHVAKIINYLNSSPLFSLNDFGELLEKLEKVEVPVAPVAPATQVVKTTVTPVEQQEKTSHTPVQEKQPVVPVEKREIPQRNENHISGGDTKPGNIGKEHAIPPAPMQTGKESGKTKSFSLFGFLSSKDKKESKAKTEKHPEKPSPFTNFEVPGTPALDTTFDIPGQPAASSTQPAVPQPTVQPRVVKTEVAPAIEAKPAQMHNKTLSFGETTVLGGSIGETTVLGVTAEPNRRDPHLIRSKNNEKIPLNKPVFRIGKERSYVDYFISDNTAISRGHANIVDHGGEYFVVDTNSTNHTYLNGTMIQSGVETKLSHGDKVRLANEDFEFRLY